MKKLILLTVLGILLTSGTVSAAMNVTLAWDPNSETDLAGYRLFYRTTVFTSSTTVPALGTAGWTIVDIPLSSLANRALPEKAVTNLTAVTTWFALTAYDNGTPSLQSTFSNVVQVNPPNVPPVAPTGLRVSSVVQAEGARVLQLVSDPVEGAERLEVYSVLEGKWTVVPYEEGVRNGKTVAIAVKGLPLWTGTKGWYVQAGNAAGRSGYKYIALTRSVNVSTGLRYSNVTDNVRW